MQKITEISLKERWETFKNENPKVRIRDAAKQLNTSEAALLATETGNTVTLLAGDFSELLKEVTSLGYVMALTRNDHVVHERKGIYEKVSFGEHAGLVLGEDIDLRLFMQYWKFGFAVQEGDRKSFQFFDKSGEAVHKIYLTDKSNLEVYTQLVDKYKSTIQNGEIETEAYPKTEFEKPDGEIEVEAFRNAWREMKDTHEFFGLLRRFKLTRTQALRLGPEEFIQKVSNEATRKMLNEASYKEVPIMVFVSSRGCIQIHTGWVKKLVESGPWYNVLDPEFNLHLREDKIANTWIVKKPTADGIVTSLEIFDADGENIALFFGKRKPGIPEKEEWKNILSELK